MPYIPKQDRNRDTKAHPKNPGQLNWILTDAIVWYLKDHGQSYQTINDILGALEGCKLEFVRRVVNPYEARKASENTDVY